ncbi:MAG: CHAP domain-containing protein [Acidimicrobiales bacterium]
MSMALGIGLVLLGPFGLFTPRAASAQAGPIGHPAPAKSAAPRSVESPTWWKGGICDPENAPGSESLGASWHGLVACGPGPTQGGSDHVVYFFPGAWGELEWECVELSMRWMYLAWGVNPYPADGWDVVRDYPLYRARYNPDGPQLVVVTNGTPGAAPQPGDVVSIGRTQDNEFGHTAVVTADAVDAQGNGTITLIQQNGGTGNDGWATYAVNNWVVADGVTGWLHNPSWTYQWPLVGFTDRDGFQAGVVAPGNGYAQLTTNASSLAVSGYVGATGSNGGAIYGYIDHAGNFFAQQGSSSTWYLEAQDVGSIAVAATTSGTPALAFLSTTGDFYAEEGSLTGPFTLEATGASSIAVAAGTSSAPPLLGYVRAVDGAFLVKTGVVGSNWNVVQSSGVRSIALAQGSTPSGGLIGYLSDAGSFYVSPEAPEVRWTPEATGVTAISLALVGAGDLPLLGYLAGTSFYAAEGENPAPWVDEANGVAEMAVAAEPEPGASPVLGYVTAGGGLEVMQGRLSGRFSLQSDDASSFALSSVTDS